MHSINVIGLIKNNKLDSVWRRTKYIRVWKAYHIRPAERNSTVSPGREDFLDIGELSSNTTKGCALKESYARLFAQKSGAG